MGPLASIGLFACYVQVAGRSSSLRRRGSARDFAVMGFEPIELALIFTEQLLKFRYDIGDPRVKAAVGDGTLIGGDLAFLLANQQGQQERQFRIMMRRHTRIK